MCYQNVVLIEHVLDSQIRKALRFSAGTHSSPLAKTIFLYQPGASNSVDLSPTPQPTFLKKLPGRRPPRRCRVFSGL